ncbi:hypothetical protein QG053_03310, partial [Kingella kingae]|uniref:hypothetical protein n=1 Tax=Kingella kingae TaxID=504 RepID=UPI00254E56A6
NAAKTTATSPNNSAQVMPILDNWATSPVAPATYAASSWGPKEAQELLARDGNVWLEEQA